MKRTSTIFPSEPATSAGSFLKASRLLFGFGGFFVFFFLFCCAFLFDKMFDILAGLEEGIRTPKPGYKSITVKSEIYDYFYNEWLKVKEEYTIEKGIRSF